MTIKVSVIIPVYNVENYLEKCLDSVINQTLKDIEIICINDGSTDKSLEILEKYAKKDDRIKILSQKNSGAGAARNSGLNIVRGKYISFVDSDDWIDLMTYEKLYSAAVSQDIDMIFFKMLNYHNDEDKYYNTSYYDLMCIKEFFTDSTYDFKDLKDNLFCIPVSPCNKLYKRNFLESINSKFNEGLIFEDNPFFFNNIINAKKILLYDEYFYFRRRIKTSIMQSVDNRHFDIIPITNEIIEIFKNNGLFENFREDLLNKKITLIRNLVYDRLDENYKNDFFELLKYDFSLIKRDCDLNEDNLTPINKFFYLNSQKTNNFKEFDLLNKNSDLKLKINKLEQNFRRENKLLSEVNIKLNKKNVKLNKKNIKLDERINKLNEKNVNLNKNKNKLEKELNDVFSSNSWKITKPLRKIFNKIK